MNWEDIRLEVQEIWPEADEDNIDALCEIIERVAYQTESDWQE